MEGIRLNGLQLLIKSKTSDKRDQKYSDYFRYSAEMMCQMLVSTEKKGKKRQSISTLIPGIPSCVGGKGELN